MLLYMFDYMRAYRCLSIIRSRNHVISYYLQIVYSNYNSAIVRTNILAAYVMTEAGIISLGMIPGSDYSSSGKLYNGIEMKVPIFNELLLVRNHPASCVPSR